MSLNYDLVKKTDRELRAIKSIRAYSPNMIQMKVSESATFSTVVLGGGYPKEAYIRFTPAESPTIASIQVLISESSDFSTISPSLAFSTGNINAMWHKTLQGSSFGADIGMESGWSSPDTTVYIKAIVSGSDSGTFTFSTS